jgi:ribonuclease P protein component
LFFARARHDAADSAVALGARFGITVTRKVGNAVIRNRIKRIVREGCRHAVGLFPQKLDLVIVARSSAAMAATDEVAAELADVARRLGSRSTR